jgi:hypothetical protein
MTRTGKTAASAGTAAILFAILVAPAEAQTAAPGASPGASPPPSMRQQPARPGPRAAVPGGGRVSNLTEDECRRLGGQIYTAPNCSKTGKRCTMKLAGGDIYAPCIDE